MSKEHGVKVKNVYHMLAYAFRDLKMRQYEQVGTEDFEHIHNLFAAVFSKGISRQLKQGLYREYVPHEQALMTLRGRVDLPRTTRLRVQRRRQLACEFDQLSEDNLFNQVVKAAALTLIRHGDVKREHRDALKKELFYFSEVTDINLVEVNWSMIRFARQNRSYRTLLALSRLLTDGLLMTEQSGNQKLRGFLDDQAMHRLYEKFLLEYYKKHWPSLCPRASQIDWALDEDGGPFLPAMQTDVTLNGAGDVLIIDAKYYSQNTQGQFDSHTVHSGNLYQMFTYVKNKAKEDPTKQASGLVLYAQTHHQVQPEATWTIDGNTIMVDTLDLNQEFDRITEKLDGIAVSNLGLIPADRCA